MQGRGARTAKQLKGGGPLYLVAFDGTAGSEVALDRAAEMAEVMGASLLVATVCDARTLYSKDGPDPAVVSEIGPGSGPCEAVALAGAARARQRGVPARSTVLQETSGVANALVLCAQEEEAAMIVVGTQGDTRLKRLLLGSVAGQVVERAHCPVFVVR